MKIVIQLMPCNLRECDYTMTDVKNIVLSQINNGLNNFAKDHIHSIEVLGD